MKHLVLVGFMGSGKTAIGKRVAKALGLPFIDTDAHIEARAGRSIPEIFQSQGEAAFRDLESEVIRNVAEGPASIVSTGGGALLRPQNVEALKRNGVLIHLYVDAETVLKRTGNRKSRPLLDGYENPLERIQTLMDARKEIYAQADAEVSTVSRPFEKIAAEVIETWKRLGGAEEGPILTTAQGSE